MFIYNASENLGVWEHRGRSDSHHNSNETWILKFFSVVLRLYIMFVLEGFSFEHQGKCLTDKDRSTTGKNATEFIFEQILTVSLLLSYNLCNHSLSEAPSAYFIQQFNRTFWVRSRILVWRLFFPLQPNVLKVKYEMFNICIMQLP